MNTIKSNFRLWDIIILIIIICVCVCACMCKCKCAYLLKIKNKGIFRLSGGFKLSLWVISTLLGKSRLKLLKMRLRICISTSKKKCTEIRCICVRGLWVLCLCDSQQTIINWLQLVIYQTIQNALHFRFVILKTSLVLIICCQSVDEPQTAIFSQNILPYARM